MALAWLISSACLSGALADEQIQIPSASGVPPVEPFLPVGEPLTDFETMELHYRRYTTAAQTMAQLFRQLNQKIQEVSLAAKTAEAKSSSHNRRMLADKLRQLENTRTSYSHQYAQLQSQMQNEYRSYTAISNDLKVRHHTPKDTKGSQETTGELNPKSNKAKGSKTSGPRIKEEDARGPTPAVISEPPQVQR
jgi:hypothetical protein